MTPEQIGCRADVLNLLAEALKLVGETTESSNVEDELERLVENLRARKLTENPAAHAGWSTP